MFKKPLLLLRSLYMAAPPPESYILRFSAGMERPDVTGTLLVTLGISVLVDAFLPGSRVEAFGVQRIAQYYWGTRGVPS